jgi:hypothetical protein
VPRVNGTPPPQRIEDTLLVIEGFKFDGLEYRAGDRVPVQHRSIRRLAAEHPGWFCMEYETTDIDLEWLARVEAEYEATYQDSKRFRDGAKERQERALREELKEQDRRQPALERRFAEQQAADEKRKREVREERERRQIEQELALADMHTGFHFDD